MKRRFLSSIVTIAVAGALLWAGGANYGDSSTPGPLRTPMTFPVIGKVSYTDTFGAPRDGGARTHEGIDVMGTKMQPLVAAAGGTVTTLTTTPSASAGYMLVVTGDDGWSYHYLHINNDTPGTDDGQATLDQVFAPGLKKGDRVDAGQLVAFIGDSGNAESTSPHVHFELHDPSGVAVNPYASLKAATVLAAPGDPAPAVPDLPRIWGRDRVATAIAASKSAWSTSANVVLASGSAYAEALPASVLAARKLGPLLLADDGDLSARVVNEINRLRATKVIIVGSVPASADAAVAAPGRVVERVAGADAVETAAALARVIGASSGNAVVVNADRFADGVSASALAAGRSWPILLTSDTALPDVTRATLESLKVARTWVVGGSAVVSDGVVAAVPGGQRLAGADRYETSVEVVRKVMSLGGRSLGRTYLATGTAYPDALAGGALAARTAGVVVLVDGSGAGSDAASRDYLQSQGAVLRAVLGGFAAVGVDATRSLGQLFGVA